MSGPSALEWKDTLKDLWLSKGILDNNCLITSSLLLSSWNVVFVRLQWVFLVFGTFEKRSTVSREWLLQYYNSVLGEKIKIPSSFPTMVSCAFPIPVLLLSQVAVLVRACSPFPGETLIRCVSLQEWEGPQFSGSTACVFPWVLSGMARANSANLSFLSVPTSSPSLSALLYLHNKQTQSVFSLDFLISFFIF